MLVTLTLGEIVESYPSLERFCSEEFDAVLAWKLQKVYREVKKESDDYEKIRQSLVKKYGMSSEEGGLMVAPRYQEKFADELEEFISQEVTLTIEPIDRDLLQDYRLRPRDLGLLWYIFEEETKESPETKTDHK